MTDKKTKASATQKTAKKTAAKKVVAKKTASTKKPATKKAIDTKPSVKKATVAREGEAADKKATPIVFSMDDIEALVATRKKEKKPEPEKAPVKKKVVPVKKTVVVEDKPVEKRVLGAASLADILGFNPAEKKKVTSLEEDSIPKKWKKYYKLLLDLRQHVSAELNLHTSDTLKHEAGANKIDSDSGTDTFDHDFALSLVSSEQDALNEVEEAILRIKDGTYGVCEVTGETIGKEQTNR